MAGRRSNLGIHRDKRTDGVGCGCGYHLWGFSPFRGIKKNDVEITSEETAVLKSRFYRNILWCNTSGIQGVFFPLKASGSIIE